MSEENNTEETPQAATLTRDEVSEMINKTVNAAVSTHNKRLMKGIESQITDALAPLAEKLNSAPAASETSESAEDPAAKQLKAQLDAMKAQLESEKNQREMEKGKRLVAEERDVLRSTLLNNGVPADKVELAEAYLYDRHKRVARDEEGNIQFLVPEQGYTDKLSMSEGISKFLKTDTGKSFLPPKDAGGSGSRGGGRPSAKEDENAKNDAIIADFFGFGG